MIVFFLSKIFYISIKNNKKKPDIKAIMIYTCN